MRKLSALALAMALSANAFALEVGGVDLPEKIEKESRQLTLNGAGGR